MKPFRFISDLWSKQWAKPELIWSRDGKGRLQLKTAKGRFIGRIEPQAEGFGFDAVYGERRKPFLTVTQAEGWLEWIAQPYWRRW